MGVDEATRRILVVDDEPIVAYGLRELLEAERSLDVIADARTTKLAQDLLTRDPFELVVLDVAIEGDRGLDLIRWNAAEVGRPLLVFSRREESLYARRCLRAGAHGFVSKRDGPNTLLGAIRAILDGERHVSPRVSTRLVERVAAGSPFDTSEVDTLTDRELEVLELLGEGWTTSEIAAELGLGLKTIQSYCGSIKSKLSLKNNNQLIRRATVWVIDGR